MGMALRRMAPAGTLRRKPWKALSESPKEHSTAFPAVLIARAFAFIMQNLPLFHPTLMRQMRSMICVQTASYKAGCQPTTVPRIL
jgi:hypothetical protein